MPYLSAHPDNSHPNDFWALCHLFTQLCKSKVVLVMLAASLVGMALTPAHTQEPLTILSGLMGIGLAACGSAALNHLFEADIDKKMARTAQRPLAKKALPAQAVLTFSLLLITLSTAILIYTTNMLATLLTLSTTLGYAVLYTRWLKPATPQNIVIGGLSGAMPPLLGWSCLTGTIAAEPIALVLIIFCWTPAHFWPLAIHNRKDYAKTTLPMLPNTHGIAFTQTAILAYAYLTFAVSFLPFCLHTAGWLYLGGNLLLNSKWLYLAHQLKKDIRLAMPVFLYSITYLYCLFILLIVDHLFFNSYAHFSYF